MILGPPTPCFQELDDAVCLMQRDRGDMRPVIFHWQADIEAIPLGSIIWNFDFPGVHFGLGQMRRAAERASEVWDFSRRGVRTWRAIGVEAKHAPVGFHPSMVRFERRPVRDLDLVFVGSVNDRRLSVLRALESRGWRVRVAPVDRRARDSMLSRAELSLNMLYYEGGTYPMLRAAHLLANGVPYVGEVAPESEQDPRHSQFVAYDRIVGEVERALRGHHPNEVMRDTRGAFSEKPMVLPV